MIRILTKLDCNKSKIGSALPGDIFITSANELCLLINRSHDNKSLVKCFVDNSSYSVRNDTEIYLVKNSLL